MCKAKFKQVNPLYHSILMSGIMSDFSSVPKMSFSDWQTLKNMYVEETDDQISF